MELFALLFAIAAGLAFLAAAARTRSLTAAGLALLDVAWVLQTCVLTGWHAVVR